MPIASGVVIPVDLERQQRLAEQLGNEPGIEISGIGPTGIAVVLESETMAAMTSLTSKVVALPDVVDLRMTYCNWEDQF